MMWIHRGRWGVQPNRVLASGLHAAARGRSWYLVPCACEGADENLGESRVLDYVCRRARVAEEI
jgi:hypothetical protein